MDFLLKLLFGIVLIALPWFATAMSSDKHADEVTTFEIVRSDKDYNTVDEKEMEMYTSPFISSILKNPGHIPQLIDLHTVKYQFIEGEQPFKFKDLEGILIEGEGLEPGDIKLFSHLTGDGWKWWFIGSGTKTVTGLYFPLEKLFPYYSDPLNNYYSPTDGDMGFDLENCLPSFARTFTGKGKKIKAALFIKKKDSVETPPRLELVS